MKKGLVITIFTILLVTLFTTNTAQAVDPEVSVQPRLIQDDQMKPSDPPPDSHPTANQYTAPVTNPGNAYDNNQMTSSLTNITQQPYPSLYSRPTANSGNATVTNAANAYDMIPSSFAAVDFNVNHPSMRQFSVITFNTTSISTVSSVDLRITYAMTIDSVGSNVSYRIVLYVGTKYTVLVSSGWTNSSTADPTQGTWNAVSEPNDGVWNRTDVGNLRISFETKRSRTQDDATLKVYEVWIYVYPQVIRYFAVTTFNPTSISAYSYLNVHMNYTAIIAGCSYRILVSVGSANTTVQSWVTTSQINPAEVVWERITEPNDGWWNQTDLSNARIVIETQKTQSQNNGEFYVYEAWVTISPPTVNSYPSANSGTATVTNPTRAYDKNQMTYASIGAPATTTWVYFTVQSFNTTTLKEYATLNIQMRYNFTAWNCQYRIYVQVGTKTLDLQPQTNVNQTTPIVATWTGVSEPNDGAWNQTDLANMQVRVAARRTQSTGDYSFGFREYETWATIPENSFTVRVYVSGIQALAPLYAWQFNLTFNPAVLQAVTVAEGPFLKLAGPFGVTNYAGSTISNTAGWVLAGCAVDDWFGGGVSGSGTLATITFTAIAKGNAIFNFTDTLLRSFDEVTELPVPLTHTRSPGWFQYLAGDVNGDAIVNVADLYRIGRAYGSTSGGPNWDQDADQNKDNTVNGPDLSLLNQNFGKN